MPTPFEPQFGIRRLIDRVRANPRIRGEFFWVGLHKTSIFILQLVVLKALTNLLGHDTYGEFQLALTGMLLIGNVLVMPVQNSYLRVYHSTAESGGARHAALFTFRWFAVATGGIALACGAASAPLAPVLGIERWTLLAAGLYFLGNQWRMLGVFIKNIERHRKAAALQAIGNMICQLLLAVVLIVVLGRTATAAILGFAISAILFAAAFDTPIVRDVTRMKRDGKSRIWQSVRTFGLPFGLLLMFQWVQGFTDRYMIAALMDKEFAGVYIAAFQVCGVPFMLMWFFLEALLTPIMYQRAKNAGNPRQLWNAYRIFLGGVGLYLTIGAVSIIGLWLGGRWLLVSLTNESYALPTLTIVILSLARFVQCLTFLLDRAFTVNESMGTSLILRGAMSLITIPVCWYFIREHGLLGAAISALAVGSLHVLLQIVMPGGCAQAILKARNGALSSAATSAPAEEMPP